jgi:hypothetical protein
LRSQPVLSAWIIIVKAVLIILFIYLTDPLAAHAIASSYNKDKDEKTIREMDHDLKSFSGIFPDVVKKVFRHLGHRHREYYGCAGGLDP